MTKKRILFVDDDHDILTAFRRLLWRDRNRWDMVFAAGPAAGLEQLALGPFDVVVCDLRMPGMSGAAFLREVAARCPTASRVLLSGGAEASALDEAIGVSDHLLHKPCTGHALRAAIELPRALGE
jgi:DNA-binding NtrC family response regulator